MVSQFDYISFASLVISLMAVSVTLIRFKKESKRQRQADLVSTLTDIVKLIDNDRAVESRGILRKNKILNMLKDGRDDSAMLITQIDSETEEAARYVATTYDRLGFILKHDKELEEEVLQWHGYVIVDMWMLTGDLVMKKWRQRSQAYLLEFEKLSKKAIDHENNASMSQ